MLLHESGFSQGKLTVAVGRTSHPADLVRYEVVVQSGTKQLLQ